MPPSLYSCLAQSMELEYLPFPGDACWIWGEERRRERGERRGGREGGREGWRGKEGERGEEGGRGKGKEGSMEDGREEGREEEGAMSCRQRIIIC